MYTLSTWNWWKPGLKFYCDNFFQTHILNKGALNTYAVQWYTSADLCFTALNGWSNRSTQTRWFMPEECCQRLLLRGPATGMGPAGHLAFKSGGNQPYVSTSRNRSLNFTASSDLTNVLHTVFHLLLLFSVRSHVSFSKHGTDAEKVSQLIPDAIMFERRRKQWQQGSVSGVRAGVIGPNNAE